ncbi:MAG: hypothetical protein ACLQPD_36600 [Desulfomonilaceae bacterium]
MLRKEIVGICIVLTLGLVAVVWLSLTEKKCLWATLTMPMMDTVIALSVMTILIIAVHMAAKYSMKGSSN